MVHIDSSMLDGTDLSLGYADSDGAGKRKLEYSQGDSNPCVRRERATS